MKAAIEIQAELTCKPAVSVRIGIHLGDVVLDSEGVYGDAVNVAARIEALAQPGSILISGKVQAETANHPEIVTRPVGTFEFKNVGQPTTLYSVSHHKMETKAEKIRSKWDEMTSQHTMMKLILPYITNINEGLTN